MKLGLIFKIGTGILGADKKTLGRERLRKAGPNVLLTSVLVK